MCTVPHQSGHILIMELCAVLRHSGHILNTKLCTLPHQSGHILNTVLYPARSRWGTYRGYCSRMDGARTSVKTGSWAGRTHSQ